MPRKIATQVGSSVSRLLSVGSLKSPPAFFSALTLHPPNSNPQRSPTDRSNCNDTPSPNPTPPNLNPAFIKRKEALYANLTTAQTGGHGHPLDQPPAGAASASFSPSSGRNPLNQSKRRRAQSPKLNPVPIVYQSDRIRRQFFRDHPWELSNPRNLVEMDSLLKPVRTPMGAAMELKDWGSNPGVEEVIACTLHLHENHSLSLSQAYHRTLSEYHSLRSEHETRTRFSVYEARSFGGYFPRTETERGFQLEEKALQRWRDLKEEKTKLNAFRDASELEQLSGPRLADEKNSNFTGGEDYLRKARESLKGLQEIKNSDALKENVEDRLDVEINNPETPQELKSEPSPALGPGSFSKVDPDQRAADLSLDPSGGKVLERELREKVEAGLSSGQAKR